MAIDLPMKHGDVRYSYVKFARGYMRVILYK